MGTTDERRARRRLAGTLTRLMWEQGLTSAEISRRSGVSLGYISEIRNGKVLPGDWTVLRLAKALGCSCEDLIGHPCEDERPEKVPRPAVPTEATDIFKLFVAYGGFMPKDEPRPWRLPGYKYVPFGKEKD